MINNKYDFVIIGGGCAGLGLAYRMSAHTFFDDKSILIIDPEEKNKNDRTWSYWAKDQAFFHEWAIQSWNHIEFKNDKRHLVLDAKPYKYYTIRGLDYYQHCLKQIKSTPNIHWLKESVNSFAQSIHTNKIITDKDTAIQAGMIFDSRPPTQFQTKNSLFVWQHFKGWVIETKDDFFDTDKVLLMDFSIEQKDETRFFYILPYTKRKALIEIAVFSNEVISSEEYDPIIQNYIDLTFPKLEYDILETEYNKIPMTTHSFPDSLFDGHQFIGVASGMVKSSSGYAFTRIQRQLDGIIDALTNNENSLVISREILSKKFGLLDATFMNVLLNKRLPGRKVFSQLFKNNKASDIFDFLDQKSSIWQELKIMWSLPKVPFLKAFFQELKK